MKVYSSPICPFVQRVNAVLEAKKVKYEVEYVDLMNLPDWFIEISPNAEVPILETDNNAVLFESFAICEYLEEMYPPDLHPKNSEQKANTVPGQGRRQLNTLCSAVLNSLLPKRFWKRKLEILSNCSPKLKKCLAMVHISMVKSFRWSIPPGYQYSIEAQL